MRVPYHLRPGAGFLVAVAAALLSAGFFAWGIERPRLDHVWESLIEIEAGVGDGLSKKDLKRLQETLEDYPKLAESLLQGGKAGFVSANADGVVDLDYAYLVRLSSDTPSHLRVAPTLPSEEPVQLRVRAGEAVVDGPASSAAPLIVALPPSGPFPQVIEVKRKKGEKKAGRLRSVEFLVTLEATP